MKKIVILFGPPGSGKGTQARLLGKERKWTNISMGRLLRKEKNSGSELGKKLEKEVDGGKLVSDDLVEKVIKKRLSEKDIQEGVILDGFPRTGKQLRDLDKILEGFFGSEYELTAVFVKLSDSEVKKRLGGRRVCSSCGTNYHLEFNPPQKKGVCDSCGADLYHRQDDTEEAIDQRLKEFHKNEISILEEFENRGNLVVINGEKTIEEVHKDILSRV